MKTKIKKQGIQILAVLIILLAGNMVQAQQREKQGPPPIPNEKQIEKLVGELSSELTLNMVQTESISKLFTAHFKEVKTHMEEGKKENEAHRQTMNKLRKDFEKEVKAQLSDKQQELFEEHMKKQGPKKLGRDKKDRKK